MQKKKKQGSRSAYSFQLKLPFGEFNFEGFLPDCNLPELPKRPKPKKTPAKKKAPKNNSIKTETRFHYKKTERKWR